MNSIQQKFSGRESFIDLPMGEYEGPLRISHACTVDGHGATLWVKSGTALIVDADQVVLKNLRIELTENSQGTVAVKLRSNTVTENVEVYGQEDRGGSVSSWCLPRMIELGVFAAEKANEFHRLIVTECACEITNNVHGLSLSPQRLMPGTNDVAFKISSLMGGTVLYGDIVLKTDYGISKRIYVSGWAAVGAREIHEQQPSAAGGSVDSSSQIDYTANSDTAANNSIGEKVVKGQRLGLKDVKNLFVGFVGENIKVDIDPYAFQLYGNGKTRQDSDLIFFGNKQSRQEAVYIDEKDGAKGVGINLEKIAEDVENIVVAFAVYEDANNPSASFSEVRNPLARVWIDEDKIFDFRLTLGLEKVINMLEVYRHKGEWKVKFVGAGFKDGLRVLCEQYGLDVK